MVRRRRNSGGQALILVTLGLLAMCGMMGLAVDLGWSFFVEKQAQTAADAAALGAVQEALVRLNGSSFGFSCPASPSGSLPVYCQPAPVDCVSGTLPGGTSSNLWNGCRYAQQNGFTSGGSGGRQRVTIQSNEADPLNPPPTDMCVTQMKCVKDAVYWVTARSTQTVPQLFSAVINRTEGIVSAKATAALVSVIVPGSFIALNQAGDCISRPTQESKGFVYDCGVDIDSQGGGANTCQQSGGAIAAICGGSGIILSSSCNGNGNQTGCGTTGNNNNSCANGGDYAGCTQGSTSRVWGLSIQIQTGGWVDDSSCTQAGSGACSDWTPRPVNTGNQTLFQDPLHKLSQPPIAASGPIATCGIPGGTISNASASPLVLGPYQYYAINAQGQPTGAPINLTGDVTFSASSTLCSNGSSGAVGSGASPLSTQFGTFLFYGGLQMTTNNTFTFGAGQYVMVGTASQTGPSFVLGSGGNPHVVGNTFGTQFITTAPSYNGTGYPGLATQMSASALTSLANGSVPLYQGYIDISTGSSGSADLYGLDRNNLFGLPPEIENLGNYSGNLFWQDRRNSTLQLSTTDGSVVSKPCYANGCSTLPTVLTDNRVTFSSPKLNYTSNANLNLHGAVYQPRGAWFRSGGGGNTHARVQIVTGMILKDGSAQLDLLPTDRPSVKFIDALIE
ncbi:MAG: hypothetical protein JWO19_1671 [Bryobacterales bacterium]|nr:hypothetical protein [Bryobacterales bacterium]